MNFVAADEPPLAARWTSRIAVFSLMVALTGLLLHRLFAMPTPIAFNLVKTAFAGAAMALLMALVAAVQIWRSGGSGTARVVLGLMVSGAILAAIPAAILLAREHPPLNDVSTDVATPPVFATLAGERKADANPATYPADRFAALQARFYPDLQPMMVNRSSEEAFELSGEALRRLHMQIAREESPGEDGGPGFIEAVDRTMIAGFYDDVIIRVTGDAKRARIDLRSASRYGEVDFGRNAERLRAIMREIVARLEATVPAADGTVAGREKPGDKSSLKRAKDRETKRAIPRSERDRAQSDARREPIPKAKPPAAENPKSPDRRPGQSFE